MTMLPSHRAALRVLVLSSAAVVTSMSMPRIDTRRAQPPIVPVPRASVDAPLSALPPELVPAVIDTLQSSGGQAFQVKATGSGSPTARNADHRLAARFEEHGVNVASDSDTAFAQALTLSARAVAIDGATLPLLGERYAYIYLHAWDASGRFLPAKLTALDRGLQIAVDVRDSALPITIDPLLQQAILTVSLAPGSGLGT